MRWTAAILLPACGLSPGNIVLMICAEAGFGRATTMTAMKMRRRKRGEDTTVNDAGSVSVVILSTTDTMTSHSTTAIIHVTFVASSIALAWIDRITYPEAEAH